MKLLFVTLLCLLPLSMAMTNVTTYLDYIQSIALNQSIMASFGDFFDKREKLMEEHLVNGATSLGSSSFYCADMASKSITPPASVHSLHINDISVMAALGDSITAGFGAGAHSLVEMPLEYRGLAFSIGGDSDLKYSITLPNIVKQFSSMVVGPSERVSPEWFVKFAQFNVAVSGATADGLMDQATELIARMRNDTRVNWQNDWKLVTVFIGTNDFCQFCTDTTKYSAVAFKRHLTDTLYLLKASLPKTLVQLVTPNHMQFLREVSRSSSYCVETQKICPCLMNSAMDATVLEYQRAVKSVESEFIATDDFAVVVQPFLEKTSVPLDMYNQPDLSFFAPDCFHLSQWGHSLLAKSLWLNMHQSTSAKSSMVDLKNVQLMCPNKACPLLRTPANSQDCTKYLQAAPKLAPVPGAAMNLANMNALETGLPGSQSQAVPMVIRDNGSTATLVLVGLALGLIFGLVVGSLAYHSLTQRRQRQVLPSEKTPLLGNHQRDPRGNDNYVQIY